MIENQSVELGFPLDLRCRGVIGYPLLPAYNFNNFHIFAIFHIFFILTIFSLFLYF